MAGIAGGSRAAFRARRTLPGFAVAVAAAGIFAAVAPAPAALAAPGLPRPADARRLPRSVEREIAVARAPRTQLVLAKRTSSGGARFYRFRQEVAGLPVLGSETVLTATSAGPDLLLDHSRAAPRRPSALGSPGHPPPAAQISRAEAIRLGRAAARVLALRARPRARLALLAGPGGLRPAWQVLLPSRVPLGTLEALIDARTGRTIRVRDLARRATGSAALFDPNAVVANGSPAGLSDGFDADSPQLTGLRRAVTLQRLDAASTCLKGLWAEAVLGTGSVCKADRDWTAVTRSDDRFEALMAYLHTDRAQSFLQSLGFANVVARPFRVVADAFSADTSFYDPVDDEIQLGAGGVDDGEDGEVIVHEYGHAVQEDQAPGFGTSVEGGAVGEGFGDYLSATVTTAFTPDSRFDACLAEWDAVGLGIGGQVPCLRRVDGALTVPQLGPGTDCDAEIHCLGQAWSGVLWTLRGQLGAGVADRIAIQSNFSLASSSGFQDASLALLAADRQLFAGSHEAAIRQVLASRGLIDLERIDDTPAGATGLAVPGSASGTLDAGTDGRDYYRLGLAAGRGIVVRMTGQGDFDLRLLRPGSSGPEEPGAILAGSSTGGGSESFDYLASTAGDYLLEAFATSGGGPYSLQVLGDADGDTLPDGEDNCPQRQNFGQEDRDHDGIGDRCDRFPRDPRNDRDGDGVGGSLDNCPSARNPSQADWDHDGRGDRCDRSARVRITSLRVAGRRARITLLVRPPHLAPRALRVSIERLGCGAGGCRYRLAKTVRGRRRAGWGRVAAFARLRPGAYRLRAAVHARGVHRARSAPAGVVVR